MDSVSLLTKKGYLTISLNHVKDGRVLLRRHEGINEWYSMIKVILEEDKGVVQYDKGKNRRGKKSCID